MTLLRALPLLATLAASTALAQQPTTLRHIEGTDPATGTEYARIVLPGQSVSSTTSLTPIDFAGTSTPTLIAQCTREVSGKPGFELFLSFGDVTDLDFHAPVAPSPTHPRPQRVSLTLDFSGYTHLDGVKRQFEELREPSGLFRYATPGMHSSNLDDASILLRYLVALPTVRLSEADRSALFHTSPLLTDIRSEPLCGASHL